MYEKEGFLQYAPEIESSKGDRLTGDPPQQSNPNIVDEDSDRGSCAHHGTRLADSSDPFPYFT